MDTEVEQSPLRDLERALPLLRVLTGLDLSRYKASVLQRRLVTHSREAGAASVAAYLDWLEEGGAAAADDARRLVDRLSVRVSSFFRDPEVFRALEQGVYPELFAAGAADTGDTPLAVWCVGCSRGQEAYSLAFSMLRYAARHDLHREVSVLATDVDEEALQFALRGEYPARLMDGVEPEVRREAFEPCGADGWRIAPRVRAAVRFQRGDALDFDSHPHIDPGFSLISCRNLLIYLDRPVQEDLILALHGRLRAGGYLLLGASETVLGRPWHVLQHLDPAHRIYRRPPEGG